MRGRPLEEGSRPMINGLYAHGTGDARLQTPPEKENRYGDDVFVARAELRALEALNSKLTTELCGLEERAQQLEWDAQGAQALKDSVNHKLRAAQAEVTS